MGSIAVNEIATYNVVSSSHVFPFTCWQEVALDSSWVSEACHDVQGAMFGIYAPSITKQSLPRVAVFELLLLGALLIRFNLPWTAVWFEPIGLQANSLLVCGSRLITSILPDLAPREVLLY